LRFAFYCYLLFIKIDNVVIEVHMPKTVMNMQLTPSQGKYTFDTSKKHLLWDIGKIDASKIPTIKGNVI
jgi:AP-3 complex subunit mu